jgi:hypothetical protein
MAPIHRLTSLSTLGASLHPVRPSGFGALQRAPHPHCPRRRTFCFLVLVRLFGSGNVVDRQPLAAIQIAYCGYIARASGRRAKFTRGIYMKSRKQNAVSVFHQSLYEEKNIHKEHRNDFVKMKMVFIATVFGVSSLSIGTKQIDLFYLLLLIPLLCFSTDIYILAEDYKIKRIGKYIREYPKYFDDDEILWEDLLHKNADRMREKCGKANSFIVSGFFCMCGAFLYLVFSNIRIEDIFLFNSYASIGFIIYFIELTIFIVIVFHIKRINDQKIKVK